MYKSKTLINLQYKGLHSFYWMLYCLSTAFITVFLLAQGLSAASIGVIVALSNILAAAGQLAVGNVTDRYEKITWRNAILGIGALQFICLVLLIICSSSFFINAGVYLLFTILVYFQMPLVNSAVFTYEACGISVDFGSARGMGSIAYALISFAAGQLIASIGTNAIIYLSLAVLAGLLAVTFSMPSGERHKTGDPRGCDESCGCSETCGCGEIPPTHKRGIVSFAKKYPAFMLTLLGIVLLMAFHNIVHTYMIQMIEPLGGDSASMGTAFSIEALMELPVMFGFYKLIQRFSPGALIAFAGFAFILKALAYIAAGSVTGIYLAQSLQMLSYAIFISASVYYANEKMEAIDRVTGQSYMTASISIGAVLGNLAGGFVLDAGGVKALLCFALALTAAGAVITGLGVKKV